jgi:CubicO group peptidase (beta-lactamase class C family)
MEENMKTRDGRIVPSPSRRILLAALGGLAFLVSLAGPAFSSRQAPQASVDEKIKRIENGLLGRVKIKGRAYGTKSLADRMIFYKVPALSIAVIKDNKVEWGKAYGFSDLETRVRATPDTLFQAASISKAVAAAAALRYVEKGLLDLDEDVNIRLKTWKVPESPLTLQAKVTLREILSHSAGLTVHGFEGYPAGKPAPTLAQVLDGLPPANSAPIRVDILPGSKWRYSGGGYTVMQQMLIDILGRPFPEIMKETVLKPAGMTSSTYEQPLPPERLAESAVGYRSAGTPVAGRRHVYPEMAAAGLWTTPGDLCRFAIEIINDWNGKPDGVLSPAMARQMLTVQKSPSGLGVFLQGNGDNLSFGHSGGNEGFRCDLVAFPVKGIGVAVMTNSDAGGALYDEVLRAVATEYGLPGYEPVEKEILAMIPEVLDRFAGRYETEFDGRKIGIEIIRKDDHLLMSAIGMDMDLYPETGSRFFTMDLGLALEFSFDGKGQVAGFVDDRGIKATKISAQAKSAA